MSLQMVTDRDEEDVQYAKQFRNMALSQWKTLEPDAEQQWRRGLKGCYKASDLTRVSFAAEYVAAMLEDLGAPVHPVEPKLWKSGTVPNLIELNRLLERVRYLRRKVGIGQAEALPESYSNLTYREANAIESNLVQMEQTLLKAAPVNVYCGAPVCGTSFFFLSPVQKKGRAFESYRYAGTVFCGTKFFWKGV